MKVPSFKDGTLLFGGDCPVLYCQVLNAPELVGIIRHQRQTETAGMRGNKEIVCADHRAASFQVRTNLRVVRCGFVREIDNFDVSVKCDRSDFILTSSRRRFDAE